MKGYTKQCHIEGGHPRCIFVKVYIILSGSNI